MTHHRLSCTTLADRPLEKLLPRHKQVRDEERSSGLTERRDVLRVAAKVGYVRLDPLEHGDYVVRAVVAAQTVRVFLGEVVARAEACASGQISASA